MLDLNLLLSLINISWENTGLNWHLNHWLKLKFEVTFDPTHKESQQANQVGLNNLTGIGNTDDIMQGNAIKLSFTLKVYLELNRKASLMTKNILFLINCNSLQTIIKQLQLGHIRHVDNDFDQSEAVSTQMTHMKKTDSMTDKNTEIWDFLGLEMYKIMISKIKSVINPKTDY